MKKVHFPYVACAAALLGALSAPTGALAQYVWVDDKGVKQYSDMPPPPSVPSKQILKFPGQRQRAGESPSASMEGASANPSSAPKTLAEQNAEFKKRRTEQAEKEKKEADEAHIASEKSKNCDRNRDYQRALESGERIAHTDRNGERSFLTDEQRARELSETRKVVQGCK